MKDIDYITLDIGKFIIKRYGIYKEYYKEVNNELFELSEEEKKVIEDILDNNKYNEIYYSEFLDSIILNNPKLEEKEYLKIFFDYLENSIPEGCKDNLYRNISTLETELNFQSNFKEEIKGNNNYIISSYNTNKNKLTISVEELSRVWDIAKNTSNPNDFFWKQINSTVLHELLHMASSKYDEKSGISVCGFNTYPYTEEEDRNRGLTEGMTEVIAFAGIPGTAELSSAYYIECLLINQLFQIVGINIMAESYFANKGIIGIKKKLNELIQDEDMATILFRRIEDNFYLKDIDCKQTTLANIQSSLIQYFKIKLLNDINNGIDYDSVLNYIAIFEQMLVTKDILINIKKNPNNYLLLDNSIQEFYKVKEEVLLLIQSDSLREEKTSLMNK